MDLLDSEDSDGTSGEEVQEPRGENGSDGVPGPTQHDRAVRVPRLSGDCIGDDATKVHQKATRYIALQSGGTGSNWQHWGHFWATGLQELGGDVGAIAEAHIYTEAAHHCGRIRQPVGRCMDGVREQAVLGLVTTPGVMPDAILSRGGLHRV